MKTPPSFEAPFTLLSPFRPATGLLLAAAALLLHLPGSARAGVVLTWDSTGTNAATPVAGPGTWSSGAANWSNGATDSGWANANGDTAQFLGSLSSAATVTLGEAITVNNLVFNNTGSQSYTISGSAANVLSVTTGQISVSTRSATIQANIGGSNGLIKSGNATLTLFLANSYTGATIIQSGILQARTTGALPTSTIVTIGDAVLNATATLDVRANQTVAGIGTAGSGTSNITNSQVAGTTILTINPDGGASPADSTVSGIIKDGDATHFLALTKAGSHTLTLTGNSNAYSGATTVTGGSLIVNGTLGTSTVNSAVTVASAGTLGGSGTIAGSVDVSGKLAAGNSIGTLSTGNLSLGGTGTLAVELGSSGGLASSDRVNVTGTVTIASGANLELTLFSGLSAAQAGDVLWLVTNNNADADSISGAFTKLNGVATTLSEGSQFTWNSQLWKITYQGNFETVDFNGAGNDIAIQVVPEPSALAPLAALAAGLLLIHRRRR